MNTIKSQKEVIELLNKSIIAVYEWHQQQVINGKWEIKEKTAKEYAERNNMQSKLLFDEQCKLLFKKTDEIV